MKITVHDDEAYRQAKIMLVENGYEILAETYATNMVYELIWWINNGNIVTLELRSVVELIYGNPLD